MFLSSQVQLIPAKTDTLVRNSAVVHGGDWVFLPLLNLSGVLTSHAPSVPGRELMLFGTAYTHGWRRRGRDAASYTSNLPILAVSAHALSRRRKEEEQHLAPV